MFKVRVTMDTSDFERRVREEAERRDRQIEQILDLAGKRTVEYLRGYTGNVRPPPKISDDPSAKVAYWRKAVENARASGSDQQIAKAAANLQAAERREAALQPEARKAHPGGWADVTHTLEESYGYEVSHNGAVWQLAIFNSAKHAHLVEAMSGFFVVSGVADKGGPVYAALLRAVKEVAPGWEVTA